MAAKVDFCLLIVILSIVLFSLLPKWHSYSYPYVGGMLRYAIYLKMKHSVQVPKWSHQHIKVIFPILRLEATAYHMEAKEVSCRMCFRRWFYRRFEKKDIFSKKILESKKKKSPLFLKYFVMVFGKNCHMMLKIVAFSSILIACGNST